MLEIIQLQPFFKENSDMLLFPFNQTLFSLKLLFSFLPPLQVFVGAGEDAGFGTDFCFLGFFCRFSK